jgi:hypothetical protein
MASIIRDPNGRKRISFTSGDGDRKTIRLGKLSVRDAESFKLRIEALLSCQFAGVAPDVDLSRWLGELPDAMYEKLVTVELVEPRERAVSVTLGEMLAAYFQTVDVKPSTLTRMEQAKRTLIKHFGNDVDVGTITRAEAEAWRKGLKDHGYANATISRTVRLARQFIRWGVEQGLVEHNVFEGLKAGSQTNSKRQVFVTQEAIAKVIEAAPDAEWRLLIALGRGWVGCASRREAVASCGGVMWTGQH